MNHSSLVDNSHTHVYYMGLVLKMKITQCTGHVSANSRLHQLHWGDREWAYYMSCTHNTDDWPYRCFLKQYRVHTTHTHACTHTTHMHAHAHTHTHTHIHIHTHVHKHTRTHTHTQLTQPVVAHIPERYQSQFGLFLVFLRDLILP